MYQKTLTGCLVVGMLLSSGSFSIAEKMPSADSNALWKYIFEVHPYQQWSFWPDHQGMQEGRAPHGEQHRVFVNKVGLDSMTAPAQYGTIQVKENYNSEGLKAITVMYKIKNYNPESGDWFWAKYTPEGVPLLAGKLEKCIGCHATKAENDFIVVHDFK